MNRAAYESSVIDWPRLRNYALRVARDTKVPTTPPIAYTKKNWTETRDERIVRKGIFGIGRHTAMVTSRKQISKKVEALGSHWLLNQRQWRIETKSGGSSTDETTYFENKYVVLMLSGELKVVTVYVEEALAGGRFQLDEGHWSHDLDESDVIDLDFTEEDQKFENSNSRGWGNRARGHRLLRHSKGVGLSLLLKRLVV